MNFELCSVFLLVKTMDSNREPTLNTMEISKHVAIALEIFKTRQLPIYTREICHTCISHNDLGICKCLNNFQVGDKLMLPPQID
ncbi:hypothetical protein Lalb_Chr16g0386051 [Lupinus albus]|uniref:Uncharacterized protein n=1 Tax=Lupinus albus TaxID=3870 RepID=A0A6A4NY50_LUPAL|nr:hypothetical protein Lalb_Chr16g0386051 [Lupinus albus]